MRQPADIAVVGGGIAGLAIAEMFSRDGSKVVLIEKNDRLCREASAAQHGWFHFGSLYSIFPQNQFLRTMVGGVEDLLQYYGGFDGMNIHISPSGTLSFPQTPKAWFRDEPIEYVIASRNDPDFNLKSFGGLANYARKLFFLATWELAIKQFISRHQRFHRHNWHSQTSAAQWIAKAGIADYSRDVIEKPRQDANVQLDRDTHFQVKGYDRPMRSRNIATSLLERFLSQSGEVLLSRPVTSISDKVNDLRTVHFENAPPLQARTVIVASGQWLETLLPGIIKVKTVVSPIIVAYPAVADRNFVRMTPFVDKSINHLWHEVDGKAYSVIGGGHYADPAKPDDVRRTRDELAAKARSVFPQLAHCNVVESYSGFKSEMVAQSGERNYQYFIREAGNGLFAVLPGKFSLSFSLAVNTFKAVTGRAPATRSAPQQTASDSSQDVAYSRHASLVQEYLKHNSQAEGAMGTGP